MLSNRKIAYTLLVDSCIMSSFPFLNAVILRKDSLHCIARSAKRRKELRLVNNKVVTSTIQNSVFKVRTKLDRNILRGKIINEFLVFLAVLLGIIFQLADKVPVKPLMVYVI